MTDIKIANPQVREVQDNIINRFIENSATMQEIDFAVWVLHIVYGWSPDKIRRMSVDKMVRWLTYAKKRMTVGNWIGVNTYFRPREVKKTWLQKILKKN